MHSPIFRVSQEAPTAAGTVGGIETQAPETLIHFDGHNMATKDLMLDEFGRALGVSDWWGHNWDALVDVLRDCWFDTTQLPVLVFHHAGAIGAADEESCGTLVSILRIVASEARQLHGRPVYVRMLPDDPQAVGKKIVQCLEDDELREQHDVSPQEEVLVGE